MDLSPQKTNLRSEYEAKNQFTTGLKYLPLLIEKHLLNSSLWNASSTPFVDLSGKIEKKFVTRPYSEARLDDRSKRKRKETILW